MTSVCGWSMGVTQARKFQNYTPQKNLGAKIKVLRFHWMRVYDKGTGTCKSDILKLIYFGIKVSDLMCFGCVHLKA